MPRALHDLKIRLATEADLPEIRRLIPEAVRALSRGFYSPAQIESAIRYIFGPDSQLVADRTYFAAEEKRAIVGCGGWSRRRTLYGGDQAKAAEDPLLDPAVDAARIRAFFVDPAWARRGIGSAILDACARAAREAGFGRLELVATLPGERLYRARGFEPIEVMDETLPDGETWQLVRMSRAV